MTDQTTSEKSVENATEIKPVTVAEVRRQVEIVRAQFGTLSQLETDGTFAVFIKGQDTGQEVNAEGTKALIKAVQDFTIEGEELDAGKRAVIGELCAKYILQKAVTTNSDKVADNLLGSAISVVPPHPMRNKNPEAVFSIFKEVDEAEHSRLVESAYNKVKFESESDEVLKAALAIFDETTNRMAEAQAKASKQPANPELARRMALANEAVSYRMDKQKIVDESVGFAKLGYGFDAGGPLEALQSGVLKINEWEAANNPFAKVKPTKTTPTGLIDFEIAMVSLTKSGKSVIALDKFTGVMNEYTREDLVGLLRDEKNPDISGIILPIILLDTYSKFMGDKEPKNHAVHMEVENKEIVERFAVAFDSEEELAKKIKDGTYKAIKNEGFIAPPGQKPDFWQQYRFNVEEQPTAPQQMAFTRLNPDAEAKVYFAPFDKEAFETLTDLSKLRKEIFDPLCAEFKDDVEIRHRLREFKKGAGMDQPSATRHPVTEFLKSIVTRDISKTALEAILDEYKPEPEKYEYWSARFTELSELQASHDEEVAAYQEEVAEMQRKTQVTLARGRQSDKAYEAWKDIHKLPRQKRGAAQLKAFCPSVANDVDVNATTTGPDYDYIDLAIESWKKARKSEVAAAMGDMNPAETALMNYSIEAAEDTMRYIVLLELAAYDPTITMRQEKDVFYKHLDKASPTGIKVNKAIDPIAHADTLIMDWLDKYYESEGVNLIDIVTYKQADTAGGQSSFHYNQTHVYCMSDFFLNAKIRTSAGALDYVGLSGVANYFMSKDSPTLNERKLKAAINDNKLDSLGIEKERFDQIVALSTHVANRPEETKDLFKGTSLLTGDYIRWRCEQGEQKAAAIVKLQNGMKP
jgi:hypothetical protein